MKVSELIKLLEVAKAQYGDLECVNPEFMDIDRVELSKSVIAPELPGMIKIG